MKNNIFKLIVVFVITYMLSCNDKSNKKDYGFPLVDSSIALRSGADFVKYYYPLIKLEEEFTALNQSSQILSKGNFFDSLLTGNFLPLKQKNKETNFYRLVKFGKNVAPSIPETIKVLAYYAFENFKMEGQSFPPFDFNDLENNNYTNVNTKGKIVIFKFWFIGCTKCIEEMPELNKIEMKYKKNNDILFLSLAFDQKDALIKFLKKIQFNYKVIPNQKKFVVSKLNIRVFPTHIIVDRNGIIKNVFSSVDYVEKGILKELSSRN